MDFDGKHSLMNTVEGRRKPKNVRRDPRVAINVISGDDLCHMATVRRRVVEITNEGADEHIDKLAKKYLGQDTSPFREPGKRRIMLKIEPEHVMTDPPS